MKYKEYKERYFVRPRPVPRYHFSGACSVTLYFEDFKAAEHFYSSVLGPPAYVEGTGTRGWPAGEGWLTLLQGKSGNPQNTEITWTMKTNKEAKRLQQAFLNAGGKGAPPENTLMYDPVLACPVTDPFGMDHMIICKREFNTEYQGDQLSRTAFPIGGMGAGMFCLEGSGAFSHFSFRHKPDIYNEPIFFAAIKMISPDKQARILEGPVPDWKVFGQRGSGNGSSGKTYGLPRFSRATFESHFPFAAIDLEDEAIPIDCKLTAWSPFSPGNDDDSSLPAGIMEYTFRNAESIAVEAIFSIHAENFLANSTAGGAVRQAENGFVLHQGSCDPKTNNEASAGIFCGNPGALVDCAWFRGGWFDGVSLLWKQLEKGEISPRPSIESGSPSPGGSLYYPIKLAPGESLTIPIILTWYIPSSNVSSLPEETEDKSDTGSCGCRGDEKTHVPWYAGAFDSLQAVTAFVLEHLTRLRRESHTFSETFFSMTLPPELIEAAGANLSILKSPTVLRQKNGRLWGWEGCGDDTGCCPGSCTHVWNYAQAIPHLFPRLERSLRRTEFFESQNEAGHQAFRAALPVCEKVDHEFHAAADGQLGGIMKAYRDWRISGDTEWLRLNWSAIVSSLEYCIHTWDPDEAGYLREPHHNTYDIEYWGPNGHCTSIYLGALKAAYLMAEALGESHSRYHTIYSKGRRFMETELFDGEYFIQRIEWEGLRAGNPAEHQSWNNNYSSEALALMKEEGPKYQYGCGCLSDGVIGAWMAEVCGIGEILDPEKVRSHLLSVYKYNLRHNLNDHINPQRPGFAMGQEGGLLLCTWPKGGELSLPFVYSNEVWTGIEYQVASHLMLMDCMQEGLEIVQLARRRYDGRVRNPFNEYECGHWYARAMASYSLLQGYTGIRYDAVEKVLYVKSDPNLNFRSFLSTASGYGMVEVENGEVALHPVSGEIHVDRIVAS